MFKHSNLFIAVLLVTLISFLEKQERQIRKLENSLSKSYFTIEIFFYFFIYFFYFKRTRIS